MGIFSPEYVNAALEKTAGFNPLAKKKSVALRGLLGGLAGAPLGAAVGAAPGVAYMATAGYRNRGFLNTIGDVLSGYVGALGGGGIGLIGGAAGGSALAARGALKHNKRVDRDRLLAALGAAGLVGAGGAYAHGRRNSK